MIIEVKDRQLEGKTKSNEQQAVLKYVAGTGHQEQEMHLESMMSPATPQFVLPYTSHWMF